MQRGRRRVMPNAKPAIIACEEYWRRKVFGVSGHGMLGYEALSIAIFYGQVMKKTFDTSLCNERNTW
ncbi:hypothetical protein BCON_0659g00030 [Botryotinia convoluta]|uniref:Uncharacterized protein n=1 Tax=Botryotinia convoluta TaxID=54673 RepID=A0A4Z1H617_9HELO|nr:hypothetical protein BCON_0659g00030 [Botryotinia convoluta]